MRLVAGSPSLRAFGRLLGMGVGYPRAIKLGASLPSSMNPHAGMQESHRLQAVLWGVQHGFAQGVVLIPVTPLRKEAPACGACGSPHRVSCRKPHHRKARTGTSQYATDNGLRELPPREKWIPDLP